MEVDVRRVFDALIAKINKNTEDILGVNDGFAKHTEQLEKHTKGFEALRDAFIKMNSQARESQARVALLESKVETLESLVKAAVESSATPPVIKTRRRRRVRDGDTGTEFRDGSGGDAVCEPAVTVAEGFADTVCG